MDLDGLVLKIKNNLISFIIIGVCLMLAMKTYNAKKGELELLVQANDMEMKKNEVLQEISGLEKNLHTLQEKVNNKEINSLISSVSSVAKDSNVKILFIKPGYEEKFPIYSRYPFELSVSAPTYHMLGKFVSRLENAADFYTLDTIDISAAGPDQVTAKLTLSTIQIR